MSGKGSAPRPIPDRQGYEANWDAIQWGVRDGVPCVHEAQGEDEEGQGTADGKANGES